MPVGQLNGLMARTVHAFGAMGARPPTIELTAMPPCLRPADALFMAEWAEDRFALAGHSIALERRSPFDIDQAPAPWLRALHEFAWLRHIPASIAPDAMSRLHTLVQDWLRHRGRRHATTTDHAVTARRLLSWLAHADLLLDTDDARFYDAVLTALMADVAALRRRWRSLLHPGTRLLALIALNQASLCLSSEGAARRAETEAWLAHDLATKPVHGQPNLSRDPDALTDILIDLETLRLLYVMQRLAPPTALTTATTRFSQTLGGLMLGHAAPARLGTSSCPREARLRLTTLMRHVDVPAVRSCHNSDAGYVRLVGGQTCVVTDVGAPISSRSALGFEMTSGQAPFITHDSPDTAIGADNRGTLLSPQGARQDAAPGTRRSVAMDTLEPGNDVVVSLLDGAAHHVDATHRGHAPSGFVHRRRLTLDASGRQLTGCDEQRMLAGHDVGAHGMGPGSFTLSFTLHPSVTLAFAAEPDQLDLTLANGHQWRLTARAHQISVEGASAADGDRALPRLQILILAGASRSINWTLTRLH